MTDSVPPFEFDAERLMGLDDSELALATYGLFVEFLASRYGLSASQLSDTSIDRLAAAIDEMDPNTPDSVILQRSFSLVLSGNTAKAGKLLSKHFDDRSVLHAALEEAVTGSRRQRRNASQGGGDHLTRLIYELVKDSDGAITEKELLSKLKRGGAESYWSVDIKGVLVPIIDIIGIFDDIDDGWLYYLNKDGSGNHKVRVSNLRGRLSRAKKKFRAEQSR